MKTVLGVLFIVKNNELFDKAKKLKGYGSFLKSENKKNIEKIVTLKTGLKVKPTVIKTLREYFDFISQLETSYQNPVFYRGQTNANYLLSPNSLRIDPANENLLIESFSRRFSNEIDSCHGSMAKLVLMQHFGLGTRCLDISENPLAALYFACQPYKKFRKFNNSQEEENSWGEITIFREPVVDNEIKPEKLKTIESSNVSVMANTAFMENEFSLWHLGVRWKEDVNQGHDEKYIDLKSIVRGSLIVRVPQNNPRIKNQQGAFIVVNANEIWVEKDESYWKELTKFIINSDSVSFAALASKSKWKVDFNSIKTWELKFTKVKPYDESNELEEFKTDPFELSKLFYKKDGVQQVVLIHPDYKKTIVKELERFNITEDFIYPDMDTVANEINERINFRK